MLDFLIVFAVVITPSILAILLIDQFSGVHSPYRTREQELGAAGVFQNWSTRANRPARSPGIAGLGASEVQPATTARPGRTAPVGNGSEAGWLAPGSQGQLAEHHA